MLVNFFSHHYSSWFWVLEIRNVDSGNVHVSPANILWFCCAQPWKSFHQRKVFFCGGHEWNDITIFLHLFSHFFLFLGCEQLSLMHFVWILTQIIHEQVSSSIPYCFSYLCPTFGWYELHFAWSSVRPSVCKKQSVKPAGTQVSHCLQCFQYHQNVIKF